ncbi:MAG TPA: oligosaccharide flippase family protein, partial [Clostridia bacterium]|nr:oligosaccharide flippase family protein [Clostridia bacterium]
MISIAAARRTFLSAPARSVATLMSATMAAQALTFLCTPLLTRLYSQEAYGTAGVYLALVSTVGVLITGKYELAIPLAREDRSAKEVLGLCLAIAAALCSLLGLLVWLWPVDIARVLRSPALAPWLWLLPLSLLALGAYQAFSLWCNRDGDFLPLAVSRLLRSVMTVGPAIPLAAWLDKGAGGLILGGLIGQTSALLWIAGTVLRKNPVPFRDTRIESLRKQARRYSDLPLFHASSSLIDNYALAAPLLFINGFHGAQAAGALNLAGLVLGTPVNLLSESFGQVFFQRVTEARRCGLGLQRLLFKSTLVLTAIAAPAMLTIGVAAPLLFGLLFGAGWQVAGQYARCLALSYAFKLIVSPLSLLLPAAGRVKWGAAWKICYGITTTVALAIAGPMGATVFLGAIVLNDAVMY